MTFALGEGLDSKWAFELHEIAEVLPLGRFTPVPSAPEGLLGVFNLRGEIIPIIDLATVLRLAPATPQPGGCLLVLRRPELEVGLKIAHVDRIKRYLPEELFADAAAAGDAAERSVKTVARDGTQILNLAAVLSHAVFSVR